MATLTVQTIPIASAGQVVTFAAASSGGDAVPNAGGDVTLRMAASGAQRTVTVASPRNCNHGKNHDLTVVINDGDTEEVLLSPADRFNDSNGLVQLTYDSEVGLTLAATKPAAG